MTLFKRSLVCIAVVGLMAGCDDETKYVEVPSDYSPVVAEGKTLTNTPDVVVKGEATQAIRESFTTGIPIEWIRVHNLPDYVYFDHSMHFNSGIGCKSCHGNIAAMDIVMQTESLSMGWCLECHRNPDMHLRPQTEVTNMNWQNPDNQQEFALQIKKEKNILPPVDCSGCHR